MDGPRVLNASLTPLPSPTPTGVCAQWTIMMSLEAQDHEFMGYVPYSLFPSVP